MELFLAIGVIVVKVVIVIAVLLILPVPLTWLERKIAGHMQQRLGPMRVGWHGVLQPVADGIKLIVKEDLIPDRADKLIFKLAPIISLVPPFAVFVAIPFGDSFSVLGTEITLYISDMNIGILYIFAVAGLEIYGVIFGGWASNSKYAMTITTLTTITPMARKSSTVAS